MKRGLPFFPLGLVRPLHLRNVGHVFAKRRREIDLMFLFLLEDFPEMFGHRVLAQGFALPDAFAVVPHGFVLVVEIEPQHLARLFGRLHRLDAHRGRSAQVVDQFGNDQSVLQLLAGMLLPALAKAKAKGQGILCMSNLKQLVLAWQLYAGDFDDHCANNFTIPDTEQAISSGRMNNWVNNVMTWGVGTGFIERSVTNEAWVKNGILSRYTSGALGLYRCPADNYLSAAQRRAGFKARLRSMSMNVFLGGWGGDDGGWGAEVSAYKIYQKTADLSTPGPAKVWVFLDMRPDSIDMGNFGVCMDGYPNQPNAYRFFDLPGAYHARACGFSFADGHSELKKWQDARTTPPLQTDVAFNDQFSSPGNVDIGWLQERATRLK